MTLDDALKKGMQLFNKGRKREASKFFLAIKSKQPDHGQSNYYLGLIAQGEKNYEKAFPLIKKGLESDSQNITYWEAFVSILVDLNQQQDIEKVLIQAEAVGISEKEIDKLRTKYLITPKLPDINKINEIERETVQEITRLIHTQQNTEALNTCLKLYEQYALSPILNNFLGIIKKSMNDFKSAETYFLKAIDIHSTYTEAYLNIINLYKSVGHEQRVIQYLKKIINLDPTNPQFYIMLANEYINQHSYADALRKCEQVLSKDNSYAPAYFTRGIIYFDLKDFHKSIIDFERSISIDPNTSLFHNALANAQKEMGDISKAKLSYLRAIEIGDNAKSYYNMALLQKTEGDIQGAIKNLESAIKIDKNLTNAKSELGRCLMLRGLHNEGREFVRRDEGAIRFGQDIHIVE